MWPALLPVIGTLLDKFFPNPSEAAEAKLKLMQMAQTGELAQLDADMKLALGQMEVNKVEAGSADPFTSRWRPFIGWICGSALAWNYILRPAILTGCQIAGHPVALPPAEMTELMPLLFAILGLGAFRTTEKIKGVA